MSTWSAEQRLRDRGWRIRNSAWLLPVILLVGFGTAAGFLYVAIKTRRRDWLWATVGYATATAAGIGVGLALSPTTDRLSSGGTAILACVWIIGIVHGLIINKDWLRWKAHSRPWYATPEQPRAMPPTAPSAEQPVTTAAPSGYPPASYDPVAVPGEFLGATTTHDRYLADAAPAVSFDKGTPPPSTAPTPPGVSVDVNTADVSQLAQLPGVGNDGARRLVREREARGGFTSLDEVAALLALQPHQLVRLRHVAYLPPPPHPPQPPHRPRGREVDL